MYGREVPLLWNSEWFPSLTFSSSPCEPSRLLSAILSHCLGLIVLSPSPVSFCIPDKCVSHYMHPHPRPPTTWLLPRPSLMPNGPSLHGSHLCLISAVVSLPSVTSHCPVSVVYLEMSSTYSHAPMCGNCPLTWTACLSHVPAVSTLQ